MSDALDKKINLEENPEEEKKSQLRKRLRLNFKFKPRLSAKAGLALLGVFGFLLVFLVFFLCLPLWRIKSDIPPLIASSQKVSSSIQTQDLNQAIASIEEAIELLLDENCGDRNDEGIYVNGVFGKAHTILQGYTKHTSHIQKTL